MIILLSGYAYLMESYRYWFLQIKHFQPTITSTPTLRFSVIIPARNEEQNIGKCLQTVLSQDYPSELFEVIVINDHSTDNTASIVEALKNNHSNLKLLNLQDLIAGEQLNSYKKKAIEQAIKLASGNWIITTDADCFVGPHWISLFANFIERTNALFVAAPVAFTNEHSFLSIFQCLDFMTLQGITAASVNNSFHSMCNGANLAYSKEAFFSVGGFWGIDDIASGDDMLLMHKIYKKYPGRVKYLFSKDMIVETAAMPTWKQFLNQRIRWASKADKYDDKRIVLVLISVYLFNISFLVLPFMAFWYTQVALGWLLLLAGKTIVELDFCGLLHAFLINKNCCGGFR